jgi:hypothetical protein
MSDDGRPAGVPARHGFMTGKWIDHDGFDVSIRGFGASQPVGPGRTGSAGDGLRPVVSL